MEDKNELPPIRLSSMEERPATAKIQIPISPMINTVWARMGRKRTSEQSCKNWFGSLGVWRTQRSRKRQGVREGRGVSELAHGGTMLTNGSLRRPRSGEQKGPSWGCIEVRSARPRAGTRACFALKSDGTHWASGRWRLSGGKARREREREFGQRRSDSIKPSKRS